MFNYISMLASEEMSFLEELWLSIVETYLTPKFESYENIKINTDSLLTPAMIFLAFFFGVMLSAAVMIFTKRVLGRLVRRLISRGGVGYDNAMTFSQLELDKSWAVRLFINGYTLMKAVRCREEDDFYGINPEDATQIESSIGVENTERIKVPIWRRKQDKIDFENAQKACSTSDSEKNINAASDVKASSHLDDCDINATLKIDDSQSICEETSSQCDAKTECGASADLGEESSDGKPEKIVFKTSYEASLAAPKKYKRKATDHFYVLESQKHRLKIKFDKKGTNPMGLLILAVFCIAVGVGFIKILPWILSIFDPSIGEFKNY